MKKFFKKIFKSFVDKILSVFPGLTGRLMSYILKVKKCATIHYSGPERSKIYDMITRFRQQNVPIFLSNSEANALAMCAKRTEKVPGDIAEVGVFRGGSAKIISEMKGTRELHLFDTFEGIPFVSKLDPDFIVGNFSDVRFDEVKALLKEYPKVYLHRGIFPETAGPVKDKRFSFVHLDVDVYESTLAGLQFFYPKINPGGVILSHDYLRHEGVTTAIDQFFKDKPETTLVMSDSQCVIVKL